MEHILRLFLQNTPENWSLQVHMYAYAHNSQPLSELNLSSHEIVFHTKPRIPITFELNLQRDSYVETVHHKYVQNYHSIHIMKNQI